MSKEHIITAGVFASEKITVQGLPWCRNEPKEIGLAGLTKKILCTKHNSDLSTIDDAAISSINALRKATRLANLRIKHNIKRPMIMRFHIDGQALERWFLKTFINIAYQQAYPFGTDSARVWQPSSELVEIAFGRKQFEPRAGLYYLGNEGEQIISDDRHRAITLTDRAGVLVGAMFYFRGFRFLLYQDRTGPGGEVHMVGLQLEPSQPIYHLGNIQVKLGNHLSHVIEIHW